MQNDRALVQGYSPDCVSEVCQTMYAAEAAEQMVPL